MENAARYLFRNVHKSCHLQDQRWIVGLVFTCLQKTITEQKLGIHILKLSTKIMFHVTDLIERQSRIFVTLGYHRKTDFHRNVETKPKLFFK